MDWLKDKKNLPIVVVLAVVVLLGAGGLVALETGMIGGPPPAAVTTTATTPSGAAPPSAPRFMPPAPGSPSGTLGGSYPGTPLPAGTKTASASPMSAKFINPAVGPDPFGIPGAQKRLVRQITGILNGPNGVIPLRDRLPVYNLFTLHPPPPPVLPSAGYDPGAQNYRLTGVENSDGGILAILETSGQSQTVKPGDILPDGGKVLSIQASSITLRSPGGSTVSVPLTSGAGPADQSQNGQDPNGGNFPSPGQPFNGPPMPIFTGPPMPGQ